MHYVYLIRSLLHHHESCTRLTSDLRQGFGWQMVLAQSREFSGEFVQADRFGTGGHRETVAATMDVK